MDLGLSGKVAVVSAASKGLGKAVALGLAREGVRVAICSRDEKNLSAAAEEIRAQTGAEVLPVVCDVTDADQIREMVRRTIERFGTVHILFNNAGGPPAGRFDDFTDGDWEAAFRLNFMSALRFTREVLPYMRAQRWGRIINSTSITVKQPLDLLLLSNSIRTAVVGMAKTLADEVAPYNITVNNVCPGRISTERVRELDEARARRENRPVEEVVREWEKAIPMGRYGRTDEFANLVVFLASEAASYITGTTILVDGGMYRGLY